jgi:hypothetical protein
VEPESTARFTSEPWSKCRKKKEKRFIQVKKKRTLKARKPEVSLDRADAIIDGGRESIARLIGRLAPASDRGV